MTIGIQHTPPDHLRGDERWHRPTDDPGIGEVEVIRSMANGPWQWTVVVSVMELIREDPLETDIRQAMIAELRAVPGVVRASEDDREVWIVDGSPSGEMLTQAAANVIDRFAQRCREHIVETFGA